MVNMGTNVCVKLNCDWLCIDSAIWNVWKSNKNSVYSERGPFLVKCRKCELHCIHDL